MNLIDLPDLIIINIIKYLDFISMLDLKFSCVFLNNFITNKYCRCNSITNIIKKNYHFNDNGINYANIKRYLVKFTTRNSLLIKIRYIGYDYPVVFNNSLILIDNNSNNNIKLYKNIDDKDYIKKHNFVDLIMFVKTYIKEKKVIFQHDNNYLIIYDENLNYISGVYHRNIKTGIFDLIDNKIYYINEDEKLYKSRYNGIVLIEDFYYYGGVSSIKAYKNKLFVGLKSGNINIYKNDKFSSYFKAHNSEIYSINIYENILRNSIILYTTDKRKIKLWENKKIFRKIFFDNTENKKSIFNITFDKEGFPTCDILLDI